MNDKTIAKYTPASNNPFSFKVSTPANMAFEIRQALDHLKRQYGDVDRFVQAKLGYRNVTELYKYLGAEQIDGVALAIHQIEQGNGLIIGDQTGIGKGRQAAALIRYGVVNGYKTIFITEKSNLFSDLYRDMLDINYTDAVPFIFNNDDKSELTVEVNGAVMSMREYSGNPLFSIFSNQKQQARLIEGETDLPDGYHFLMTTYSQLQYDNKARRAAAEKSRRRRTPSKNPQFKTAFLREYAKGAIFIMDEAHNAGGSDSNTGFYIREILATAKGCCYLSATYAKNASNLPLYAIKTSIKEAGLDDKKLTNTFERGGEALQEIIASDLVKGGQMIRRQRTFEGIKVAYDYLEKDFDRHRIMFDKVAEIVRDIIAFQRDYIADIIADLDETVSEIDGGSAGVTKGTQEAGIHNAEYFNKVHNVISQLLFSIKALEVAKKAVALLKQDKKVVIAFSSTMGSFLEALGYDDGDRVEDQDFRLILEKGLKGVLKYTEKDGKGHSTTKFIEVEALGAIAQTEYRRILDKVYEVSTGISISPIDTLINFIEMQRRPADIGGEPAPYFRVRECTGRKGQIKVENGMPTYRNFKADKKRFFWEFNNGEADVLLINQSASTGVSCHASIKFGDQRKRVMIIHQAELNINTEIQKRGRINRTGQVEILNGKENMPEYLYLSTSIPAEQRLFMVLKKKLKSLDANTTGSQRSSESQLKVEDFFNKYGAKVIRNLLEEDSELNAILNDPIKLNDPERSVSLKDIPKKVTNAISIQPVAMQEKFYTTVTKQYNDYINELKENDEYDLEVDFLDYQAETLGRSLYVPGTGGYSPFAKDAYIEEVEVKTLRKPLTKSQIDQRINDYLKGRNAKDKQKAMLTAFEQEYPNLIKRRMGALAFKIKDTEEEIAEIEQKLLTTDDEKQRTRLEKKLDLRQRKLKNQQEHLEQRRLSGETDANRIRDFLGYFYAGQPIIMPFSNETGDTTTYQSGIILRVEIDESANNPYAPSNIYATAALNSGLRTRKIKLSNGQLVSATQNDTNKSSDLALKNITENWNKLASSKNTEVIQLVTGNTLLGMANGLGDAAASSVKLIKYTTKNKEIKPGIRLRTRKDAALTSILPANHPSSIQRIQALTWGEEVHFNDGYKDGLKTLKSGDVYKFQMPRSGNFSKYYKEGKLLNLLMRTPEEIEFGKKGSFKELPPRHFEGIIHERDLTAFCEVLYNKFGLTLKTDGLIEVTDIEIEVSQTPKTQSDKIYWYELPAPYKASVYPTIGFVGVENQHGLAHGKIGYNQVLSPKQRYTNSLIPIFDDASIPFDAWFQTPWSSFIAEELAITLQKTQRQSYREAIKTLGNFIFNFPHEDGNPEFVFGRIELEELGKLLYERQFGREDLRKYLGMMELELVV